MQSCVPRRRVRVLSEREAAGVEPDPQETLVVASFRTLCENPSAYEAARHMLCDSAIVPPPGSR